MLHIIINITPDVASGLKDRIKLFATKGLRGLYPKGENVERMVLDYTSICDSLDQLGILPEDAVGDILQGLSMASHVKFAKMFADYESNLKNPLMMMNLKGMTMEKISMLMETALDQYASYSLATSDNHWMTPTTHVNSASHPPQGIQV